MVTTRTVLFLLLFSIAFSSLPIGAETVLLDFSSPTCGPCQQMRPTVQRLAAAGYQVREVNIVRDPQTAARYQVTAVPTFIALVDGRETARLVGLTSYEQLQQILGAPNASRQNLSTNLPRGQSPDTFAVANPSGSGTRNGIANPFEGTTPRPGPPASGSSITSEKLIEATVKVSVEDSEGTSAGTGTIVDARSDEALVLTCGHLFRSSAGKGPITVALFQASPAGAVERTTVSGRLIDYDLERDLALVSIRPNVAVQPAAIAPTNTPLAPGTQVTTVGCNHGQNPTAIATRITAIDRYQGPPNVEIAGAPVEGRSGGGLFNAQGQLVGVCFAADPQSDEGLYASLPSVHAKLDSLGLAMVYQSPSGGNDSATPQRPGATQLASLPNPGFAVRGQEPTTPVPPANTSIAIGANTSIASLSPAEQATLEEIQRRGANSEVICIIRPRIPGGKSEVITLHNASSDFVRALSRPAASGAIPSVSQPSTAAAEQLLR